MSEMIDKIKRIITKPESVDEVILHEVIELVIYGELWQRIKDFVFDDEE